MAGDMDTRDSDRPRPRRAQTRRRSTSRPGIAVIGMTVAALVVVAVLAVQANGSQPNNQAAGSQTTTTHGPLTTAKASSNPTALPANSGSGTRIVYSISGQRVWLVTGSNTVQNTFPMVPGTISPSPGTYSVSNRYQGLTGSDGVSVVYVVIFDSSYGFDAEARVTGMPPAPTKTTKGVRTSQDNALVIWNFASDGTTVVVLS
jgi:hypothetical protein